MLSNQRVTTNLDADSQWTGETIAEQLKNPNSQLYKDLQNARENAARRKKERQKVERDYVIAETTKRKVEAVENELSQQREQGLAQSRESLEHYYQEQHALALQEEKVYGNDAFENTLLSFDTYTQQLAEVQTALHQLHNEREVILQKHAESQKAFADAFKAKLNSKAVYDINGQAVSLDISHLPANEQAKVLAKEEELLEKLRDRKPSSEAVKYQSEDHPLRQQLEGRMPLSPRPSIQERLLNELLESLVVSGRLRATNSNAVMRSTSLIVCQIQAGEVGELQAETDSYSITASEISMATNLLKMREAQLCKNRDQLASVLQNLSGCALPASSCPIL